MSAAPRLSVIVPAFKAEQVLPRCCEALLASDLTRSDWEFIIVDDGSPDRTPDIAEGYADRVLRLDPPPGGPGRVRNRGIEIARAPIALFVDSDVCVHPDVLSRVVAHFEDNEDLVALFGAYDDQPGAPGFLSAYRNLLHRYHHLKDAGEAETFWAGCGAVRVSAFREVGGFDEARYPRPQIEDIELGYRLRDEEGQILLDPEIQCQHLKRWTWGGMLRTDLKDRGIPWMRLLLERQDAGARASLNVGPTEKLKTALAVGAFGLLFMGAILLGMGVPGAGWGVLAGALGLLVHTLWNLPVVVWFARTRGLLFALGVIPLQILYYLLNGVAAATGIAGHALSGPKRQA